MNIEKTVEFVDLSAENVRAVWEIEKASFKTPWSLRSFENEISNPLAKYFCLNSGGETAGYIGVWLIAGEGHITNIAVSEKYRRRGCGEKLVKKLIEYAKTAQLAFLTLEVGKSNYAAIKLYEKCGFHEVGIRKNYYDNNEDAVLMTNGVNDAII